VWRSALVVGIVFSSVSCGGPASPSTTLLSGVWGGDHVSLTITASASHAEFECAHGDTPSAFFADDRHAFKVSGTFVREHGGPIQIGEVPDSHPALYFGTAAGDAMALTVQLSDSNTVIGTFTLTRGTPGRIVKCL